MNKVILIGRIGKEPQLKGAKNNSMYVTLSVATHEFYNTKEGKKESTMWHTVQVYGPLAQKLSLNNLKGKLVCIEGTLNYFKPSDSEQKVSFIRTDRFEFLEPKSKEADNEREGEVVNEIPF